MAFAEAPAPILVNEFNAGRFERATDNLKRDSPRLAQPGFELVHRHNADVRLVG